MNTENIDKSLFTFAAFDEMESEHIAAPRYSYWKSVWKTFFKNKFTVAVAALLIIVVAFALIQPTQSGYSPINTPNINNAELKFLKPSAEHIFGTDHVGNEVFDAVWAGARNSIIISFVCTAINMIVGIPVGALWGFSKKMDKWMIEVYNIISNVPFLLLAMILSYVLGAGMRSLIITMTCTEWIYVAYFIRTQVMIIRDREYNLASRCLGTSIGRILVKNILPYLISVIILRLALSIPGTIAMESTLSYLGIGLGIETPSLGILLRNARMYFMDYPYLLVFPAVIVSVISVTFYLVGNAFSDAADPRNHV